MKKKTLTSKQKQFANEYLVDRNCTQAAIRAGYSLRTAHSQGSRLLKNVEVKKIIDKKTLKLVEQTEMTALRAMEEVKAIATSNVRDILDYDSQRREYSFKSLDDVPPEFWKAASEVTVFETPGGTGTAYRVKMHPKLQALKMEYERHNLIGSQVGVTNNTNMFISVMDYNKALRRIGEKEIKDEDVDI